MNRAFIGLLPVDPHRLYVYWEVVRPPSSRLRLASVCGSQTVPEVAPRGGCYFHSLEPRRTYVFELLSGGHVVARSNTVELPPGVEEAAAPTGADEPLLPSSAPSSRRLR
jgi:hypothetical protein